MQGTRKLVRGMENISPTSSSPEAVCHVARSGMTEISLSPEAVPCFVRLGICERPAAAAVAPRPHPTPLLLRPMLFSVVWPVWGSMRYGHISSRTSVGSNETYIHRRARPLEWMRLRRTRPSVCNRLLDSTFHPQQGRLGLRLRVVIPGTFPAIQVCPLIRGEPFGGPRGIDAAAQHQWACYVGYHCRGQGRH